MLVNIFVCYAREDEDLLNKLKAHLRPLEQEGLIKLWYDRDISAGSEWEREISEHLNTAQIILLLVSSDFMNSDYCYSTAMKRALERHERGEALVIPIILRPVLWQGAPFGKLQALPKQANRVVTSSWPSIDHALLEVAKGIQKVVEGLSQKVLDKDQIDALFVKAKRQVATDEEYNQLFKWVSGQQKRQQLREKRIREIATQTIRQFYGRIIPEVLDRIMSMLLEDNDLNKAGEIKVSFDQPGEAEETLQELDTQQMVASRRLHVFLCHSSGDKHAVRNLYQRLKDCNIEPWLDEENLLPGQNWEYEIRKAVRATDIVIVCLSHGSVNKTGFVQKEIKFALDVADEQPEGTIFLIPLKLEKCEIPERLKHLHWVDLCKEDGFNKLIVALKHRAESIGSELAPTRCQPVIGPGSATTMVTLRDGQILIIGGDSRSEMYDPFADKWTDIYHFRPNGYFI